MTASRSGLQSLPTQIAPSAEDFPARAPLSTQSGAKPSSPTFSELTLQPKRCPTCDARYPVDFRVCPRDATPLEDAPEAEDPLLGVTLADSYQVIRVIGEGGMGRVYEARHKRLPSKRYAVKVLHGDLARQPEVVARFQREAEAVSTLMHPNVVGVFDVNQTLDGRPYLVGELLEGEQLGDYLDRVGKLPIPEAVRIVRQVCRALGAAHRSGIVHRDIKPENVFLAGAKATVKVLDFGISKLAEGSGANLTKTGVVMGTPGYMAPEQARGERVDARADVYAVGAILYRALTGSEPFEGLDQLATLSAVLVQEPKRPTLLEPSLPPALELIIQRAMAKRPSERYASVALLDQDLLPYDETETSSGGTPLAYSMMPPPAAATGSGASLRGVRMARPALVLGTLLGFAWAFGILVDAVAAVILMLGDSERLTSVEAILTVVGTFGVLLTPLVLWVRHLASVVWPSTPRCLDLASRVSRTVLISAACYAGVVLAVHVTDVLFNPEGLGRAWSGWSTVLFVISLAAGGLTWVLVTVLFKQRRAGSSAASASSEADASS